MFGGLFPVAHVFYSECSWQAIDAGLWNRSWAHWDIGEQLGALMADEIAA